MKHKILFAVRIGEPDYMEELITEQSDKIEEASAWARANGFDRLRVAVVDLGAKPDFVGAVRV